ncbi:MAG: hypothetical protein R3E87_19685 [Burkholderiaceae bacterium]
MIGVPASLMAPRRVGAAKLSGVTDTELVIGTTTSLSGPVSGPGTFRKTKAACFDRVPALGGTAGCKIRHIMYDEGLSPLKSLERTREWRSGIA